MHIPSARVYQEMRSEDASLWYVPANEGEELALLIKAPTSSIKALVAGCSLQLNFGKKGAYLCTGVRIFDIPDAPILIARIQRQAEEHGALMRALYDRVFPAFLYNEADVCLAWTNVNLNEDDAQRVIHFLGQKSQLYTGPFTKEVSHAINCFCFSEDNTVYYPNAHTIPTIDIAVSFEPWRTIDCYFYGLHDYKIITIDDKNEGNRFEREIWASLNSVFPTTLYKSPQIKIGLKTRELTDVFSFYTYGSFLIEAKDVSVVNAGFERAQKRRIAGVQKQVKKAISQLIGAANAFARGNHIFDASGRELAVSREQPPHCIVLITELMHCGDWDEIVGQLLEAMQQTGAFFHLLDLREFIALLKGSSGRAELFDYNLMQRCKLFVEKRSVFIRSNLPC